MKNAEEVAKEEGFVIGFRLNDRGVEVERLAVEKQLEKRMVLLL